MAGRGRRAHPPPVNADKQEQPHDVNKVPVPGRRLEPEMVVRLEMPLRRAPQADREKDRADDDMEAVEAGRHEEGRRVDATGARDALVKAERKRGMAVFIGLHRGEAEAEDHGDRQTYPSTFFMATGF